MKNKQIKNPTREAKKNGVQSRDRTQNFSANMRKSSAKSQKSTAAPSSFSGGALKLQNKAQINRPVQKTDISAIIKASNSKTGAGEQIKAINHSQNPDKRNLPELLSPAGSLDALRAAIAGGADAVYFGGGDFNARMGAKNFTNDELKYAIDLLHSCGGKAYITLNTLVHGREMEDYLRFAEFCHLAGADALIVADMGGAEAIHRHLPELELHASTQMSGHNLAQAELLAKRGFSRMVCARELPRDDIEYLVKNSPIEIEMFVHGALCVCHSGQCLFSSLVGGRSGNRGACAQPCRLPYRTGNGEGYPLSLKDLSLANHITELIECGVHSLKIEGRMKSPEYVFGVAKAFRTLLDEGKNASPDELASLAKIFSRGGFTDGYFERKIGTQMLGVRSDEQKTASRLELFSSKNIYETKPQKTEINVFVTLHAGEPSALTLSCGEISVTSRGRTPETAINAPLSQSDVEKNLSKLGNTPFVPGKFHADMDENIIMPISALNALRREACEMLQAELGSEKSKVGFEKYTEKAPKNEKKRLLSARFYSAEQITDSAREFFDIIYLPLHKFDGECEGVILPPVILDSERKTVETMLDEATKKGAKYALIGNLGALKLAKERSLAVHGDFRFNVYNGETVAFLEDMGAENIILSPELTLPQIRDVSGDTAVIVYGRVPLMLLEKCLSMDISDCAECQSDSVELVDRKGVAFPVLREFEHRNVIYNSAPTYMADKRAELSRAGVINQHFIFSTETPEECDEIIDAYRNQLPSNTKIRRI
ncbi:MAG: DUF3656 domain-containing protein [Eubacteriales bacterium]